MARPRRTPGRDSRALVLSAAAAEFAERGYDAARVDRIAAKARVNKAMIYYHFQSKAELYVEVLRGMFLAVGSRTRAIVDGPGSPEDKLDAWILAIVTEASARPWFPPVMLRELAAAASHLDPQTLHMADDVFASLRELLAEGQRAGVFRDVDPLLTHMTIVPAVLLFFARQRVVARRPRGAPGLTAARNQDQFVRHMQDIAQRMLRKD